MFGDISITGITSLEYYPSKECLFNCKECLTKDTVVIPKEKPRVESINEVKVCLCLDNYKIIKTILGPKLIITGRKKFKVIYTALNCEQSLHSAHWEIPFYEFILLKDYCYEKCKKMICSIFLGVEDLCITFFNKDFIDINLLFIICPKNIKHSQCSNNCHCYEFNKDCCYDFNEEHFQYFKDDCNYKKYNDYKFKFSEKNLMDRNSKKYKCDIYKFY